MRRVNAFDGQTSRKVVARIDRCVVKYHTNSAFGVQKVSKFTVTRVSSQAVLAQ